MWIGGNVFDLKRTFPAFSDSKLSQGQVGFLIVPYHQLFWIVVASVYTHTLVFSLIFAVVPGNFPYLLSSLLIHLIRYILSHPEFLDVCSSRIFRLVVQHITEMKTSYLFY